MKKIVVACFSISLLAGSLFAYAADMSAIVKAQVILGQVDQVMDKYKEVQELLDSGELELEVVEPRDDGEGEFVFPYNDDAYLTEWAEKSLNAQAGAEIAGMAGDKAANALAAKVPLGGLLGGALRGKSKEIGAVTAIGGWDFIHETSSLSFNKLSDLSVYMHVEFEGDSDYEQALAAATAIYPKLEKGHKRAIDKAYKNAKKEAKEINKAKKSD